LVLILRCPSWGTQVASLGYIGNSLGIKVSFW
jgi:hypothetical protein